MTSLLTERALTGPEFYYLWEQLVLQIVQPLAFATLGLLCLWGLLWGLKKKKAAAVVLFLLPILFCGWMIVVDVPQAVLLAKDAVGNKVGVFRDKVERLSVYRQGRNWRDRNYVHEVTCSSGAPLQRFVVSEQVYDALQKNMPVTVSYAPHSLFVVDVNGLQSFPGN